MSRVAARGVFQVCREPIRLLLLLLLLARSQREHHCPMTFSSGLHDQCVGASYTRDQQCRQPPLQTDRVDRRFVQRRIYVVVDN